MCIFSIFRFFVCTRIKQIMLMFLLFAVLSSPADALTTTATVTIKDPTATVIVNNAPMTCSIACPTSDCFYNFDSCTIEGTYTSIVTYTHTGTNCDATAMPGAPIIETAPEKVMYYCDITVPTITDDYANDDVWVNTDQTVTLTPLDATSGIKEVKYCTGAGCTPDTILLSPYMLNYNTDQNTVVRYQAWDNALYPSTSNPSLIGEFIVKLDKTLPTTTDNYGAKDGIWQKSTQTITLTPSDLAPSSGIAYTRYCTDATNTCVPSTNYAAPVPISAEGTTYFRYRSADNAGNVQAIVNRTVMIDKTAPTTTCTDCVIEDPTLASKNTTYTPDCSDLHSGCKNTTICADASCTTVYCSFDYGLNCSVGTISCTYEPNKQFWFYSCDNIGNCEIATGPLDYSVKKGDGCSCIASEECYDGACIGMSYCANLVPPEIDFDFTGSGDDFEIPLGKTRILLIKLKNPLDMPDSIELSIYGDPISIKYWSYFEGQKYQNRTKKIVHLGPKSEISVPLNVLGGKAGEYMLRVEAKSLTNSQKVSKDTQVSIVYIDKDGYSTTTPGLGFFGVVICVLFASLFMVKRKD